MVADFDRPRSTDDSFARIGGGSLGGKARGLAFVRHLLRSIRTARPVPGRADHGAARRSCSARTSSIEFLERNDLRDFAHRRDDEAEIERRFLAARRLSAGHRALAAFLRVVRYPLAVRSSSLLEDSQYQPFAGIYQTYMLPNNQPIRGACGSSNCRGDQARLRIHLRAAGQRLSAQHPVPPRGREDGGDAQKLVGQRYGKPLLPDFSGVARSHNFYPLAPARAEDGIAAVALGLGRQSSSGRTCFAVLSRASAPRGPVLVRP